MVHLRVLDPALRKPGLFELPLQMVAAVFQHMAKSDILIRVLKIIENFPSQRHINDVTEAIEIGCGTDDHAARAQNLSESFQGYIARHRQVLNDFGKKDEVEL